MREARNVACMFNLLSICNPNELSGEIEHLARIYFKHDHKTNIDNLKPTLHDRVGDLIRAGNEASIHIRSTRSWTL